MQTVNTTFGQIPGDRLGRINVHDHIIIDGAGNPHIPEDFNHTDVRLITDELNAWKMAGGGAIIDSSPIGSGRNVLLLDQVSRAAGIPLIVSSGFHKSSYYPAEHWLFSASETKLSEILIDEYEKGVLLDDQHPDTSDRGQTKAGILKIGVDSQGITPWITKIISAIGSVVGKTDVNIMIHTEPGVPFEAFLKSLASHHIPPSKVMLCHMGKSLDTQLFERLAQAGYYLEFDEMVRPAPPLAQLARAILTLFEKGYGEHVLFAGDLARRSYWKCYGGQPGLAYLMTGMKSDLLALGFTPEMLDQIWIENPRRFLIQG